MGYEFCRRVLTGGASPAALAFAMLLASTAQAQEQSQNGAGSAQQETAAEEPGQPAAAATQAADADSTIVVTGFRRSLENAIQAKVSSDIVVESISAEDIGKLPDASIAESIARLPGLTSQRLSGRAQVISIRGFAPDFSTTLLNGREQTSTGDNRAVEFDQYPSEVVNQVLVYKTPSASLIGQGLSGTVDLRTIRPLDFGKRVVSVGARGEYADLGKLNTGSKDKGYRVNATYVDQFADDTLGVALAASYISSPYQVEEFNAWGYASDGTRSVIGGTKSYVTSTELTRLGLQGTVQYRPTSNFTTTFDAFYSDFKDDQIKRGVELPLGFDGSILDPQNNGSRFNPATATLTGDLYTSGTFTNVEGVVRNDAFKRQAELYAFGWNAAYTGDDGWNVTADISLSKTDRNELIVETNAGTGRGRGVGATDTIAFESGRKGTRFRPTLNYSDPGLIQLTSPLGWGGTQIDSNGPDIINGQDGYYNNRIIEDELWQYRLDIEKEVDGGFLKSVKVGANYTDRSKSLTPDEAFLGLVANTNGTTSVRVPSEYLLKPTNLSFLGLGPVLSYDPVKLLNSGLYNRVPNLYQDVVTKGYDVEEDIMTAYVQADIESELSFAQLTGNAGVQVVWTDQFSRGFAANNAGTNPDGSPNIQITPIAGGADYVDVLPSVNLSLRFPAEFVVRFAASRQMVRPRLDELRIAQDYGLSNAEGRITGKGGNPQLRPWRANAVDLTFEKYFGRQGYLAAQLFYKKLKTYIYEQDVPFDFTGLPVNAPDSISRIGRLTLPQNGKGGELYGVEVAGTLPFNVVTPALDGFGLTGGASYTKSRVKPNPTASATDIPGYSRWVANGTAYFEKWGFSARGSVRYRSSFIGELSGFGAVRTRRRALAETIVDGQIGYDFQPGSTLEGLSIFLQGQNLTDEPFVTTNPDNPEQVIDYQSYGRRFLAGFTYKF